MNIYHMPMLNSIFIAWRLFILHLFTNIVFPHTHSQRFRWLRLHIDVMVLHFNWSNHYIQLDQSNVHAFSLKFRFGLSRPGLLCIVGNKNHSGRAIVQIVKNKRIIHLLIHLPSPTLSLSVSVSIYIDRSLNALSVKQSNETEQASIG